MIGPHLLGRTLEHDPASWNYAHTQGLVVKRNVYHTLNAPHLNQKRIGSCEGNTAAEFLNCAKALKNRQAYNDHDNLLGIQRSLYLDEADAVRLYSAATHLDNDGIPGVYPPTDTGTSGVGIAKALQQAGALSRYNWTFTWGAFLAALQAQPVMLGTNWYESMFEVTSKGYVVPPKSKLVDPDGGHAYLAHVLDWTHFRVGCTNHWVNDDETPWGPKIGGYHGFWIDFLDLQRLLIHEQGDSLVPVLM